MSLILLLPVVVLHQLTLTTAIFIDPYLATIFGCVASYDALTAATFVAIYLATVLDMCCIT